MQVHPGKKIQLELKDRGWTQRQFAFFLGKKVSELNELIKGRRNITVQRDILLSHVLGTPRKYWLDLQNEYDYSLSESEFDLSKLPKLDSKDENNHKASEQENKYEENKSSVSSLHSSPAPFSKEHNLGGREIAKKELKAASELDDKLNKEHKTDKDVDISKHQEKHTNFTLQNIKKNSENLQNIEKGDIKIKQEFSNLDSGNKKTSPEGQNSSQEKKDKNSRQRIYKPNDKFDSYFPSKEKKLEHGSKSINTNKIGKNKILDSGRKIITPEGQEKKDDQLDHFKHKEHIFRKF